jgi:hypothetical protein
MLRTLAMLVMLTVCSVCHAANSWQWDVEAQESDIPGQTKEFAHGERWLIEPRIVDDTVPRNLGNSYTGTLYYQTATMGTNWFSSTNVSISATDTGRVSAVWSGSLDFGHKGYTCWILLNSTTDETYRVAFDITLRASPGFRAATTSGVAFTSW